jgi:hypothetical protein
MNKGTRTRRKERTQLVSNRACHDNLHVSKLQRAFKEPKRVALFLASRLYNVVVDLNKQPQLPVTPLLGVGRGPIARRKRTDISDHLPVLFAEALATHPNLIAELGARR